MIEDVFNATLEGNVYMIGDLIQAELESGVEPQAILNVMMSAMEQCGKNFEEGEYFLPELVMAGDTFKTGMEILSPRMAGIARDFAGKVVLGTVSGDIHDIGKNLVGFLLKSSGFEVIDLGTDNSTEKFVQAVKEYQPAVLGMSALLTTTMQGMGDVIRALDKESLRQKTKVIIGGGPVSERFAMQISADAYATDAVEGIRKIKDLIKS